MNKEGIFIIFLHENSGNNWIVSNSWLTTKLHISNLIGIRYFELLETLIRILISIESIISVNVRLIFFIVNSNNSYPEKNTNSLIELTSKIYVLISFFKIE